MQRLNEKKQFNQQQQQQQTPIVTIHCELFCALFPLFGLFFLSFYFSFRKDENEMTQQMCFEKNN